MSTKRRTGARIATNPNGAPDVLAVWPDVRRVLLRSLRRQVDRETAEDICQDVAEKLVARAVPFASVEDLVKWAQRVASNRAIDEWRTHRRRLSGEPVPDRESSLDVARLVAHRAAIDEAAAAIRSLRPEERAALLRADSPDLADGRDARERQRDANLRERARERLRGMVHNFPAGLGTRLGNWLRRRPPTGNVAGADWGHLLAGAGIAIAILAGPLGGEPDAPSPPRPAAGTLATAPGSAGDELPTGATEGNAGSDGSGGTGTGTTGSAGTAAATSDRVVLQQVDTPFSRTTVGSEPQDPDDPDQGVLCVGDSAGSFALCAEDALAAVPLP